MKYNPSDVGVKGTLFGFPYNEKEAELIILPVGWDVTVSKGHGTAKGPAAILESSIQMDFSIYGVQHPWEFKTVLSDRNSDLINQSSDLRKRAQKIISDLELGRKNNHQKELDTINAGCRQMVEQVYKHAKDILESGKFCAVLGGDHSTPLGLIQALGERENFSILQIDAHMDLRKSYEGFTYSHASIMHNALKLKGVNALVQVGIRDFCKEEEVFVKSSDNQIKVFYDEQIKNNLQVGDSWSDWVHSIIDALSEKVYISFDIDGLEASLCPNTGTPVPGGLTYDQSIYLIDCIVRSGKKIIGFDLCEVSPGENDDWDANVGARILYRLSTGLGISQGRIKMK